MAGDGGASVLTPHAGRITRALLCAAFLLVASSAAGQVSKYGFGHGGLLGLVPLFDLGEEANAPTWFSSGLLLLCAGWLGLIARAKARDRDRFARHWVALVGIFLFLSFDETARIHDSVGGRLRDALRLGGVFYYAWVLPGGALVAAVAIAYVRFLFSLPRATRRLILLAATLYVGGALGMEMAAAVHDEVHGYDNPTTAALVTIEEAMEMTGVILFLHGLMCYAGSNAGEVRIRVAPAGTSVALRTFDPTTGTAPPPQGGVPGSVPIPQYPQSSAPPASPCRTPARSVPARPSLVS